MEHLYSAIKLLLRKRIATQEHLHFEPILSLIDLTCLNIGPILGTGVFSILTYASKYHAGPSSILSFLIAVVASCLGGLCFTELATRFPNSGPSYVYVYMTLGELPAFLIAWSMHLEYALCSALSMRSFVQYVQFLLNEKINNLKNETTFNTTSTAYLMPYLFDPSSSISLSQDSKQAIDTYHKHNHHHHNSHLTPVPANTRDDLQTAGFLFLLFLFVFLLKTRGTKIACFVSNLFIFFALLLLSGLLLVCVIYFVRIENWTIESGFFLNGIHGVFNGAAICFLSFIGYDIICSNVVKCKDVEHILPSAISLSFLLGLISTFLCAVIYTLSTPVSAQDTFASFSQYLIVLAGFFVSISSTISFFQANNLLLIHLSAHGLLPKCFYQNDFKFNRINKLTHPTTYTKTPILTSLTTFLFFICIAIAFNNDSIICMIGVGTLINYALISLSVLLLRYNKLEKLPLDLEKQNLLNSETNLDDSDYSLNLHCSKCLSLNRFYSNLNNSNKASFPAVCSNNNCSYLNDQQSVPETDLNGLQLIVALPSSFYYRQYYKQTFDKFNKIKKSWSECHLQSRICSFPSNYYNQIRSTMQVPNTSNVNSNKEFNPLNEEIIYQRELTNYRRNKPNTPQLTSCYIDKNYSSALEFDLNLNYLDKLPTVETETKVKYILLIIVLLMISMGLCTSRNDQLLWLMSTVGLKPVYWPIETISCLLSFGVIYQLVRLSKQPIHQRRNEKNALPCVPLLPICALWMHLHLALCLSISAWLTFVIWSLMGIFVYMSFSVWNSEEGGSSFKSDEEDLESQNTQEETEHIICGESDEIEELNFD